MFFSFLHEVFVPQLFHAFLQYTQYTSIPLDVYENPYSSHHNFMIITCPHSRNILDAAQNRFHQHKLHRYNVMARWRDKKCV